MSFTGKQRKRFFGSVFLVLLLLSFLASFISFDNTASAQSTYTLGSTNLGTGGVLQAIDGVVAGSVYYMPVSAPISNITVYLNVFDPTVFTGKCAVYRHSDLALVAATTERVIDLSAGSFGTGWYTFNFSTSINLQGATDYILAVWGSTTVATSVYTNVVSGSVNQGHVDSAVYTGTFPDPMVPTQNNNAYPIYTVYGDNTVVTSSPANGADVTVNGTDYPTPAHFSLSNGNHTFTSEASKVYGSNAYVFDHWLVNSTDSYSTASITLNITAPTTIEIHYTILAGVFHFYGPYDELTGNLLNENVTVTAHYADGTDIADYSFVLNGTWVYPPDYSVQYFEYLFSDNSTRQYWLDPSEIITDIYVFKGNDSTGYVINFLDYTGVLLSYPFVTVQAYVNGSLFTVEKRKVDEQNSIGANLIIGEKYQLIIGNEDYNFVYGDLFMTASTGVQLILRGVNFPKETLLMFKNVVLYGLRDFSSSSISFYYADALNATTSVNVVFTDSLGTVAYNQTFTADYVNLNWTSPVNSTSYQLDVAVVHEEYGDFTWSQYFQNEAGDGPAMFDFSFLGTWSINMTYLFPAILILFAAACFSALNAYVGAVLSVIVAAILTWIGWIPIPVGFLVAAFAFAILMALIYKKRSAMIY